MNDSHTGNNEGLRVGEWAAAGPTDARSPCPALNTLANHGLLPRDGRGLTYEMLLDVCATALNCDMHILNLPGLFHARNDPLYKRGVMSDDEIASGRNIISLDDLNLPNKIEHDASLTRHDRFLGDPVHADPVLVDEIISHSSQDSGFLSATDVAQARVARFNLSKEKNPSFVYGLFQRGIVSGESALLLNILGRNNRISIDDFKSFFLHERFPADWTKPEKFFSTSDILGHVLYDYSLFEFEGWQKLPKVKVDNSYPEYDNVLYTLNPVSSAEIEKIITPGNATNMHPSIAKNYHGLFYLQGDTGSTETVLSFANGDWHADTNAYFAPIYGIQTCGFLVSDASRNIYKALRNANTRLKMQASQETGELFASNTSDWVTKFTATPAVASGDGSGNIFNVKATIFGHFGKEYKLVRIVDGEGNKTLEYENLYLKEQGGKDLLAN
ncbi:hypothetical protein HK100_007523 [Physocladia obscura]|uniref:Heme haloperoxidase family profile domain-containing protein n=1 Tax=Physocladia obscura TaxID=109957 RepID=A0AAD5XB37_9FUNG|nr:hypothetical protein HK100_007523 [Physocladia obscura]